MYGLGCADCRDCDGGCGLGAAIALAPAPAMPRVGVSLSNPAGYTPWGSGPNPFGIQTPTRTPTPTTATPITLKPLIDVFPVLKTPTLTIPKTAVTPTPAPTVTPGPDLAPISAPPLVNVAPTVTRASGVPSPVLIADQETYGVDTSPTKDKGGFPWLLVAALAALALMGRK